MKPNIELHIEELVLDGFDPRERYRIGEALQEELSRLLKEGGVPPSLTRGGEVPQVDSGSIRARREESPKSIGSQVAQAVYGGMGK